MQCVRAPFGALLLSWWPWLQKAPAPKVMGFDASKAGVMSDADGRLCKAPGAKPKVKGFAAPTAGVEDEVGGNIGKAAPGRRPKLNLEALAEVSC